MLASDMKNQFYVSNLEIEIFVNKLLFLAYFLKYHKLNIKWIKISLYNDN